MSRARQYATTVGTTATEIMGSEYPTFRLYHNGTNDVYIGDADVTTSTGLPIGAGDTFTPSEMAHKSLRAIAADRLYGIVASGTEDVRVLVEGRNNP